MNALPTLCLDRARDHAKRIMEGGAACEAAGEAGWLAGLPVSIKDLTDVAGVRTTYGSPIFADHVPAKSHPLVERIERKGGIVIGKSNTPEFGAGGSTFNEVFGRTRNPWNTSLTCGGSTGGGAVSVATGEVWLAHGTDHGGSLRGPGTYCSVVGIRPSPGRVTRGTSNNLWSPLSVQGPMARNVADLALFLDTMAGFCPHDPLTFDAPAVSFSAGRGQAGRRPSASPSRPTSAAACRSIARSARSARRRRGASRSWAASSRKPRPTSARPTRRSCPAQPAVRGRSRAAAQEHRDKLKPDIIWNTERGLEADAADIAWAERERAAFYRRMVEFFRTYDLLVTPSAPTPAFDVNLRAPRPSTARSSTTTWPARRSTAVITITACPAMAVPCGFDQYGRPVGLQLVGKPRGEAALAAGRCRCSSSCSAFDRLLPIDPRPGTVPPTS